MTFINGIKAKEASSLFFAKGVNKTQNAQKEDTPLLSFKKTDNSQAASSGNKADTKDAQKTDTQQLNEDAMWLAELYQGLQNGEQWAVNEAKKLQVAAAPDKNDNSSNAQLLRSNNELASAIKAMVAPDKKEA